MVQTIHSIYNFLLTFLGVCVSSTRIKEMIDFVLWTTFLVASTSVRGSVIDF